MANCGGALTLGILICICSLVSAQSCYDRAIKSTGRRLYGGYRTINNPGSDSDVQNILNSAVDRLNSVSSDEINHLVYELDRDNQSNVQQLQAFKQLVNGFNYCVRFRVRLVKGDANAPPTKICVVAAYRGFSSQFPLIASNQGGISCN